MPGLSPAAVLVINIKLFLYVLFTDCQNPPSTGLYFMVGSQVYLPGSSVHISDIGPDTQSDRSNAGFALVCVTTNVNTACCRNSDNNNNGALGNWYFPNDSIVPGPSADGSHFARVRYTQQLRLVSQNNPTGPLGQYRCEIPHGNENVNALIIITTTTSVISVSIAPSSQSVVAGESVVLTCSASVTGNGTITFTWTGQRSRGPTTVQASRGNIYSDEFSLGTVSESDTGSYTCDVSFGSSSDSSIAAISVTVVTSVVISPSNPSGTAGEPITLTCTTTISGTGTPMFTWSGPSSLSQGPTAGQGSGDTYTNTLTFVRVAQSLEGTYTCQVQLGNSVEMDSEMLSVTVPTISATLRQSSTPTALHAYSITCEVSAPSSLALSSLSYTWTRNSVTIFEQSNTLDLSPLQLSENGARYTCQYTASSIYLNGNVNRMSGTLTISITVLPPTAPTNVNAVPQTTSVTLTWTQSLLDVITDYMISYNRTVGCSDALSGSTTASESPYTITRLQEFIEYQITVRARNSAGTSTAAMTRVTTLSSVPTGSPTIMLQSVSTTGFTVTWEREPCLSRNGRDVNYVIYLRLSGTSNILESEPVSVNNRTFTANSLTPGSVYTFEVAFVNQLGTGPYAALNITAFNLPFQGYIGSVSYSNNSIVNINDIGLDDNALFCYTNLPTCCRGIDDPNGGAKGTWRFPNGTDVGSRTIAPPTVLSRNRAEYAIVLHRGNSATGPTGIFTCEIPDINNRYQNIYFGIYNNSEGAPIIISLTYNTSSGILSCISTGGPATTVTWNRSGPSYQQSKIIVDTVTATYYNFLSITSSQVSDYTGNFTCSVSNRRGTSSITTGEFKSIGLSGTKSVYIVGSSVRVVCFSNFTISSIRWTSLSSSVIYTTSMIGSQELLLSIDQVSRNIDGSRFTCELTNLFPNGEVNFNTMNFMTFTEEKRSGPVVNLSTRSNNDTSLTIFWSTPEVPNGIITRYLVIIVNLKNGRNIQNTSNIDNDQFIFTESNLDPGIPYNVSIAAVNSVGPGDLSSLVTFTRELVPNVSPRNIAGVRTSETSMTIIWIKLTLTEARGFVWNYTVAYYPYLQNSIQQNLNIMYLYIDSESSSATVGGIDAKYTYGIQISANTAAGSGPLSQILIIERYSDISDTTQVIKSVQNNTGAVVAAVLVSVIAAVIIVALIFIIIILLVRRQRKSSYSTDEHKSNSKNEFHEYENVIVVNPLQVAADSNFDGEEIDLKDCPAYVINKTVFKDVEERPESTSGVYETIQ